MFNNELWNKPAGGGGSGFYDHQIDKSCRFIGSANDDGTNYMYHTRGTPTNADKCTISAWVKRGKLGSKNLMFTGGGGPGPYSWYGFNTANEFWHLQAGDQPRLESNALFRDTSAWYHIVIANDSTQGTASNRNKVYINGVQYTDWGDYSDYSTQNSDFAVNTSGVRLFVGSGGASATNSYYPFDGYIAEYVFIDGTQYAASDFGETVNGVWQPKDPSGLTFGNNGAYLKFESSGDLGNDSSGNNNDFTVTGVAAHDSMLDSPTFGSSSSGNFATIGGLEKNTGGFTFSECNLKYTNSTNQRGFIFSQGVPDSGKYYWEVRVTQFGGTQDDVYPGVCVPDIMRSNLTGDRGGASVSGAGGYTVNLYNGAAVLDGVFQSNDAIGNKRAVPQTVGIAIDRDNNTLKWTYDGSTYSSTYAIPSSGVLAPYLGSGGGTFAASGVFNFGADSTFAGLVSAGGNADENGFGDFSLAVPTGYVALCSGNLPVEDEVDPAQTDDNFPQKQFNMLQYTGNGSERTVTTQFQIDMGWNRSTIQGQNWYSLDTSRGWFGASSNNYYLKMDTTDSEATLPQYNFKAQSGNNITITNGSWFNSGGHTQQMWYWKGNGGTTSTPSGGSLATTVQANTDAGFSIVQYVGDGGTSAFTLAHGLGKKPSVVLMKDRDVNGNNNSFHCFPINTSLPANSYFYTNGSDAGSTSTNGTISNTTTTDAVIGVNRTSSSGGGQTISENGDRFLMYAWAEIEGFSKFSAYVGNGDADGTFVYCGFKPAFIALKDYDATNDWRTYDILNDPYNLSYHYLALNTNSAINSSSNTTDIDILSNGFKIRGNAGTINTNSNRYFFMAWASNPFKYATAK